MKRTYSGAGFDFEDMPSQRSFNSSQSSNVYATVPMRRRRQMVSSYRRRYKKSKVPRAIKTRGTPLGYYEIPVRTLTRIYVNTSTGMWNTNQTTGGGIGTTGYQGISFSSTLDSFAAYLGNGGFSASVFNTVPGFAGLQGVFDECKIVSESYDFWVSNQTPEAQNNANIIGAPDLFLVEDYNDGTPPASIDEVMQYSKMLRVCFDNGRYKVTYRPKVRVDMGATADEAAGTTTLSGVESSGYLQCNKPGVVHFGLKGWLAIPTSSIQSYVYELNILRTQIRRYKINK